tara:strand:- start:3066 stop:3419 length:354 start_codon:yes stop_codon:yes gene_type:complete
MSKKLPGDISLYTQAVVQYNSVGVSFDDLIMEHARDGVVMITAAYILMGKDVGDCWRIGYASSILPNPIKLFMDLAPYKLDKVAISRYRDIPYKTNDIFRVYQWDKLYNKVNHGKKT